jgi:ribonuclease J
MSTSLTFYGGLGEIGGNKILLEDRGTRVFLDFGKSFAARAKYFEWTERPRVANGVGDFLALGILPDISGIYRRDLLRLANLPEVEDRSVQAVVLSHAHSDHADYISFLREDIELYMGETTHHVIRAIEEDKDSNLEYEITEFKERPIKRGRAPLARKISTFRTGKKIKIDSIEIEPIHVDHSLPGCYGMIINTSSGTLVYTGDLRMHGTRPDLTRDFIQKASEAKLDWMLCEGTRISETNVSDEESVYRTCHQYTEKANDQDLFVFADYSYKDIDRFQTFYRIAKDSGRKLLVTPKTARYLLTLSEKDQELSKVIPSFEKDDTIGIYKHRVKTGTYADEDYDESDLELFSKAQVWKSSDVHEKKSKVIMAIGAFHLQELIDLNPGRGIYMHSSSEPFNEEGEFDEARTNNWIQRFGLVRVHAHCSGHASGRDIHQILDQIAPKKVVPIHTEHPEYFKMFHGESAIVSAEPLKPLVLS